MLQATKSGCTYGLGGGAGVGGTGDTQLVHNTVSMNNIYHLWKPNSMVYQVGSDNTFQNDMYNGSTGTAVIAGINATPTYAAGNGWASESNGAYALAAGTPGYDGAVRIPNFNDSFVGNAPDVGAAEAGAPAMKFGLAAADSTAASPVTVITVTDPLLLNPALRPANVTMAVRAQSASYPTSGTPTSTTTTTTTTTSTSSGSASTATGSTPISLTMDSSSYTVSVGQSVSFTVRLIGNGSTPTGSVAFKAGSTLISGCESIAAVNAVATCTTTALSSGSYSITGTYSGDSTYATGLAGPITETVK